MSNVRGRIAVDVLFTDSTTSSDEQSLKTITLQDATEYTTGKVAIVTGTVGTASVAINIAPSDFRDAAGDLVSFSSISRIAFSASPGASLVRSGSAIVVRSLDGEQAITSWRLSGGPLIAATAGTSAYTLVLYGS